MNETYVSVCPNLIIGRINQIIDSYHYARRVYLNNFKSEINVTGFIKKKVTKTKPELNKVFINKEIDFNLSDIQRLVQWRDIVLKNNIQKDQKDVYVTLEFLEKIDNFETILLMDKRK